jgi:hypothetical protein
VEPYPILSSIGYIAVVMLAATGLIVFTMCAWKGAKAYVKEIEDAREQAREQARIKEQDRIILTGHQ